MDTEEIPLAEQNEKTIEDYFEARPGWKAKRLNSGADFRVCRDDECFLCEIKTIKSVHANVPYTPEYFFIEERNKQQEEIEKWKEENTDARLILRQEEWQFIYGDEVEFREKYRRRKRNTEEYFKQFRKTFQECFAESQISHLPYRIRVDSVDLYVPKPYEQDAFLKWLENEILGIDRGESSQYWSVEQQKMGQAGFYSTFYQIHKPDHEDDPGSRYQVLVIGPLEANQLQVEVYACGELNIDAIDRNVQGKGKALHQLKSSAHQEPDLQIPRVIVLAFESSVGTEWARLSDYITWLLIETPTLSAVAVLERIPDGTPPSAEDGFGGWLEFQLTTPRVPSFVVYHNPKPQEVKPLPMDAFQDKWSVQLSPIMQ